MLSWYSETVHIDISEGINREQLIKLQDEDFQKKFIPNKKFGISYTTHPQSAIDTITSKAEDEALPSSDDGYNGITELHALVQRFWILRQVRECGPQDYTAVDEFCQDYFKVNTEK